MVDDTDDDKPEPQTPARETLIELRFEKNMTREDIAEHFKTSVATVRRWIKELEVPRPARRKKPKRVKNITASGEIIGELDDGYSRFERARILLEGRVVERTGRGYYLDGRPASAEDILEAAGV